MAEYYLISQLPSLDGINENTPLPISEKQFIELCSGFLSKKALKELNSLTLIPAKSYDKSAYTLINRWNEGEKNLRLALATLRAEKLNKSIPADNVSFPADILQTARTAIAAESPLEAENILNSMRLSFLESIRPTDSFSEEYIFYFSLKLKLLERMRKFDLQSGTEAYRRIYDSIMNKDKTEGEQ